MVHCVLCEDEPSHRKQLRQLLEQELQSRNLVYEIAEYDSGELLLNDLEHGRQQVDILFMDIFLGAVDGIQAARRIREQIRDGQPFSVLQIRPLALVCRHGGAPHKIPGKHKSPPIPRSESSGQP